MTTLRDIWMSKHMRSITVAERADIAQETLYKLNRKEDKTVAFGIILKVCEILEISIDEYMALQPCPKAERYREKS